MKFQEISKDNQQVSTVKSVDIVLLIERKQQKEYTKVGEKFSKIDKQPKF